MVISIPPISANAEASQTEQVWKFFTEGGFCMILLGICSLAAITAILFKFLSLRRSLVLPSALAAKVSGLGEPGERRSDGGVFDEIEAGRSTLARLCRVALRHRGETRAEITDAVQASAREEILLLHSGMGIIDATVSLAPLLGLLGMASGLVVMFGGLGENPDPTVVSRGISEALNTTVFGLALAVPAIVAHAYFLRRVDMMVARLEVLLGGFARYCEGAPKPAVPVLPSSSQP